MFSGSVVTYQANHFSLIDCVAIDIDGCLGTEIFSEVMYGNHILFCLINIESLFTISESFHIFVAALHETDIYIVYPHRGGQSEA